MNLNGLERELLAGGKACEAIFWSTQALKRVLHQQYSTAGANKMSIRKVTGTDTRGCTAVCRTWLKRSTWWPSSCTCASSATRRRASPSWPPTTGRSISSATSSSNAVQTTPSLESPTRSVDSVLQVVCGPCCVTLNSVVASLLCWSLAGFLWGALEMLPAYTFRLFNWILLQELLESKTCCLTMRERWKCLKYLCSYLNGCSYVL